jgi:hypothetical protein
MVLSVVRTLIATVHGPWPMTSSTQANNTTWHRQLATGATIFAAVGLNYGNTYPHLTLDASNNLLVISFSFSQLTHDLEAERRQLSHVHLPDDRT